MYPTLIGAGLPCKAVFLQLPTVEVAGKRVEQRVLEGGHSVPVSVIRRRFHADGDNFQKLYRDRVSQWSLYDNSDEVPRLLGEEIGGTSPRNGTDPSRDPDLAGAGAAMHRAARGACRRAEEAAKPASSKTRQEAFGERGGIGTKRNLWKLTSSQM